MENSSSKENGIFINGRAQIIEMLDYMTPDEKSTLLKNIKLRNPQLAKELYAESINFETIYVLDQVDVAQVAQFVKPPIMGVALKSAPTEFQKQFLALVNREYAEEAYNFLIKNLENEAEGIRKAKKKVSDTIAALNNRGRISL